MGEEPTCHLMSCNPAVFSKLLQFPGPNHMDDETRLMRRVIGAAFRADA